MKILIALGVIIGILIILLINTPSLEVSFNIDANIKVVKQEQLEKERKIKYNNTKANLRKYLAGYNSPLEGSEDRILSIGSKYRISPSLLLAIARVESSLGIHYVKNNIMGIGGADNMFGFNSMEDSIEYAAKLITTDRAYKRFQVTGSIEDLARVYCPPTAEEWIAGVTQFKAEIEEVVPDYRIN